MNYQDIIEYWFNPLSPEDWFAKNDTVDQYIHDHFKDVHRAACQCELSDWRESAEGRLAEIIILDQFSRNLFRDDAQAFAADAQALSLAQEAIRLGGDHSLSDDNRRAFLYMPYMHSESLKIQDESLRLFSTLDDKNYYNYAVMHRDVIVQFGRYPHRNEVIGRSSTQAEIDYLSDGGQTF